MINWIKKHKKVILITSLIILIIIAALFSPFFIDWLVTLESPYGFIANDATRNIWTMYYATLIGGSITLLGVAASIFQSQKMRRDDLLRINAPMIKIVDDKIAVEITYKIPQDFILSKCEPCKIEHTVTREVRLSIFSTTFTIENITNTFIKDLSIEIAPYPRNIEWLARSYDSYDEYEDTHHNISREAFNFITSKFNNKPLDLLNVAKNESTTLFPKSRMDTYTISCVSDTANALENLEEYIGMIPPNLIITLKYRTNLSEQYYKTTYKWLSQLKVDMDKPLDEVIQYHYIIEELDYK